MAKRVEISAEILHVLRAQRRRDGHHDRIGALAVLEVLELLRDVVRAETGEARQFVDWRCCRSRRDRPGTRRLSLRPPVHCRLPAAVPLMIVPRDAAARTQNRFISPVTPSSELLPAANCTLRLPISHRSSPCPIYPNVRFLTSAAEARQFAPDAGREIAFAGRSNAGKSSAINAITERVGARSRQPHTGPDSAHQFFRGGCRIGGWSICRDTDMRRCRSRCARVGSH